METSEHRFQRKKLVSHLAFGQLFFFKNDLTIFQLIAKDFARREAGIQVLNHPELKTAISMDEMIYHLKREEAEVISLMVEKYNR